MLRPNLALSPILGCEESGYFEYGSSDTGSNPVLPTINIITQKLPKDTEVLDGTSITMKKEIGIGNHICVIYVIIEYKLKWQNL